MEEQGFSCKFCDVIFPDLGSFLQHPCTSNEEFNLVDTFASGGEKEEDEEENKQAEGYQYKCPYCENDFIEWDVFLQHECLNDTIPYQGDPNEPSTSKKAKLVEQPKPRCDKCSKQFSTEERMIGHKKICKLSLLDPPIPQTNDLCNFTLKREAFNRKYRLYTRNLNDCYTMSDLQANLNYDLRSLVYELVKDLGPIKIAFSINVDFTKPETGDHVDSHIHAIFKTFLSGDDLDELIDQSFAEIQNIVDQYTERGSGFIIACISSIYIYAATYQPHHGGCIQSKLPKQLLYKKCLVALDCSSGCFMYSILAILYGENDRGRHVKYEKYISKHDFSQWSEDVNIDQINGFEKANQISVNVYSYNLEEKYVIPVRITKKRTSNHVNLLLYQDHFYSIVSMSRLLNSRTNRRRFHCERCLYGYDKEDKLARHMIDCENRPIQRVEMPKANSRHIIRNLNKEMKHPFVIYADFESICIPSENGRGPISSHEPSSYGYCVVDWNRKIIRKDFGHGPDVINRFLVSIRETEEWLGSYLKIYGNKPLQITPQNDQDFRFAITCWICEYTLGDDRVRDHDHLTGEYRGAAHNRCNLAYALPKRIPIFFHNLKNYDSHLLIKGMDTNIFSTNITIIPQSMERYIGWFAGRLAFLDSFAFLSASLQTLSSDLSIPEKEEILRQEWPFEDLTDLCGKAVLPYEYMDSFEKYSEDKLPPIEKFYSSLTDSNITEEMYNRMERIWSQFKCQSMCELIDVYLKLDVYLLAAVFEKFRSTSMDDFGIDPPHYMSVPGLSFAAALKMLKISLEIFTNMDLYVMIENGIRGGLTTVAKRYAKANNPMTTGYNPDLETSWLLYLDVNNLYGNAMSDILPFGNYSFVGVTNPELLITHPDDSYIGYIAEVDLEYPENLHDDHNDFPLAPHKMKITDSMLSPTARNILTRLEHKSVPTEKLVATFLFRERYVIHYRTLKYYVGKGLKVTKIHRCISFTQSSWLSPYINFCTYKRREASSPFVSSLYKLFVNSNYGKLMEDKRKRVKVDMVTKDVMAARRTRKHSCKSMKILSEDKILFQMLPDLVKLDKPIVVGFTVLELAKLHVYQLYYERFKSFYNDKISLIYSDTDSLLVEIKTENLLADMNHFKDIMDFSDLPVTHPLYSDVNKKRIGCLKDEMSGKAIEEVVALRPKLYAIKTEDGDIKKAKGIQSSVVKNKLSFNDYKSSLFNIERVKKLTRRLGSEDHTIHLYLNEKVALSPFEDKRYLLNYVDSLAYGHYKI